MTKLHCICILNIGKQLNNLFYRQNQFCMVVPPLLKRCNEITFIFDCWFWVYIVCKWVFLIWVFLSRVQAKRVISKNDSASHWIPQSAVRNPEPTLSPRAGPWDMTQSAIDHHVWTPESQNRDLVSVTWIQFRSNRNAAGARTGFRDRGGVDLVTSSGSVGIINPRTWGFLWEGEMTHLLIKQDYRHVSVTQHWKQTLNKEQSQSSKVRHSHRHLWCMQNKLCEISMSWNGPMSKRITHPSSNSKLFYN